MHAVERRFLPDWSNVFVLCGYRPSLIAHTATIPSRVDGKPDRQFGGGTPPWGYLEGGLRKSLSRSRKSSQAIPAFGRRSTTTQMIGATTRAAGKS